jgi:putative protease
VLPSGCFNTTVESITTEYNNKIEVAKCSGYRVWIPMQKINPELGFISRNFDEKIKIKNKNIQKDHNKKIRRPSW